MYHTWPHSELTASPAKVVLTSLRDEGTVALKCKQPTQVPTQGSLVLMPLLFPLHSMPKVCFSLFLPLLMPKLFHSLTKQSYLQSALGIVSLYQKGIFQLSPVIPSPMWRILEIRNIWFSSGSNQARSVMPHRSFFLLTEASKYLEIILKLCTPQ